MINNSAIYNPEDIIKKEAVAIDYTDLGEIQEVGIEYVITQKGIIIKIYFIFQNSLSIVSMAFMYGLE